MHLAETSLIKKYENDIGGSIKDVGGEVSHEDHWLPYLDNQIDAQLISKDAPTEKVREIVEEVLDERGVSQEAIDAWNQGLEDLELLKDRVDDLEDRIEIIEDLPATDITQSDIDAWNQGLEDLELLKDRVDDIEEKPAMDITQSDIDAWNQCLEDAVRYTPQPDTTKEQRRQARQNIGLDEEMLDAQWWYGPDEYGREEYE